MPKSPCIASAACRKTAGCPVELNVATILLAILALLPIPATISRPFVLIIKLITLTKSSLILLSSFAIAANSKAIVSFAIFFISDEDFIK